MDVQAGLGSSSHHSRQGQGLQSWRALGSTGWWDRAPGGPVLSGDTLLAFVNASKAGLVRSSLSPEEVISGKQQYDGGWGLGWQTLGSSVCGSLWQPRASFEEDHWPWVDFVLGACPRSHARPRAPLAAAALAAKSVGSTGAPRTLPPRLRFRDPAVFLGFLPAPRPQPGSARPAAHAFPEPRPRGPP